MKSSSWATVLWFMAAIGSGSAEAGMGLTEAPGEQGDAAVTIYYPSGAEEQPLQLGPFRLHLARAGLPERGNGRLIVISHGSGGAPWVHADLARMLVQSGFVVAMPEHRGDNCKDPSAPGPQSWKQRPAEVSRAIDAVARDPRFAPILRLNKVGLYGMSAGGHTALTLAGGQWSPALFTQHCEANIAQDFPACVGLITQLRGNWLDGPKKALALAAIRQRFGDATRYSHDDPRVQAVVAGVPFAADFDMNTLVAPRVPLGLVLAGGDKWLAPRFHSAPLRRACTTCEILADLPTAGHGALLSPPPSPVNLGEIAAGLLADPAGFDRKVLPEVDRAITSFFSSHLLP